jgi:hypothetical protein
MDFDFTNETITPDNTNILTIGGTGALELPSGTTLQEPGTAIAGAIRWNTTNTQVEYYTGASWTTFVTPISGTANQVAVSSSTGAVTLSTPSTFVAPGTLQYGTIFGYSAESLTASGTTQADATLITKTFSNISAGSATNGIRLPAPLFAGELHVLDNDTNVEIYVWPHVGGSIDANATNANTYLPAQLTMSLVWDGSTWCSVVDAITAGNSGITVSHNAGNVNVSNNGVLSIAGGTTGLTPTLPTTGAITLGGTLNISNGGTGATSTTVAFNNLSPLTTAGDTLYFNGTNNVRLPISTNGNVLSIATGEPSWVTQASMSVGSSTTSTTATNLAGGSAGSVPYQTGSGATSFVSAGTSSQVLVSGTTPTFVSVPTALGYTPVNKAGDTMAGALNLGAFQINNLGAPTLASDAATKAYVDAIGSGISVLSPVIAATTVALTATYANGATDANGGTGIGATLTNAGLQAAFSLDNYTLSVTDRVLIKNQVDQKQNGIYVVTVVGTGATNWVLTRATDANDSVINQVKNGNYVLVLNGTANIDSGWINTSPVSPEVIGTDNIVWTQFTAAQSYTAGSGLLLTGNTFSNTGVLSNVAGTGISVSSATGNVTVTNTGVTAVTAGTGISVSASTGSVTISSTTVISTTQVSTTYTVLAGDYTVFADGAAGGFTVSLPATPSTGQIHNVKKVDQTRNAIIVSGNGHNIDKYSTATINVPFLSLQFQWNSTASVWQII